jgi:hypothetical protein
MFDPICPQFSPQFAEDSCTSAAIVFRSCMLSLLSSNKSVSEPTASKRSVSSLVRSETITDVEAHTQKLREQIRDWRKYWKEAAERYEQNGQLAASKEAASAVEFIERYVKYRLEKVLQMPAAERHDALKFFVPFSMDGGMETFLQHFFQFDVINDQLEFVERDPYYKENHILYDIYKIKKTVEAIDVMQSTVGVAERQFPSRFAEKEKQEILLSLRKVLQMLIVNTIKPEFQKTVYQQVNPKFVDSKSVLERREKGMLYCYPHVIQKYNYRNLFFFLFFREGMISKVKGKPVKMHYNYLHFEILKQEFLAFWLQQNLQKNPAKEQIYERYEVEGDTIASHVRRDPAQELPLLKKIPPNIFNDIVAQVDAKVTEQLKAKSPSMSEKHGQMSLFRKAVSKSIEYTQMPLEALRDLVKTTNATMEVVAPDEEVLAGEQEEDADPHDAAAQDWPRAEFSEAVQIHKPTHSDLSFGFLTQASAKYNARLNIFKNYMDAEDFQRLQEGVNFVMQKYRDTPVLHIRRIPKHDWTVPYFVRQNKDGYLYETLFVLGGEASVKPKGMLYSAAGDEYQFRPYLVFAFFREMEEYGVNLGDRQLKEQTFWEYDLREEKVRFAAMEVLNLILEHERADSEAHPPSET